jgi:TetR/AcrR family fatty acid metabolism transcriptional regulator
LKKNKPKYKQIINAAVLVFAEFGYHQAKVTNIAKQANVADGTIYLYFQNKEDILISVFREKMGDFIENIQQNIAGKSSAAEKLLVMIQTHLSDLAADPKYAIVTQLELRQANKDVRLKINEVLKGYLQVIDHILKVGIEDGVFYPDLDIRLARQMIFGTIDEVITSWVMKDQKYDLEQLVEPLYKLLIEGITKK